MKYDVKWAIERWQRGGAPKLIPFWGHTPQPGKIGKSCLSQWYDCFFEVDGVRYHTAEQYMMAQKALLFGDSQTLDAIMAAETPADCKALGRKVKGFDHEKWDAAKYDIVLRGSLAKFSQNPELWAYLDGTGDAVLAEASPCDDIWGVKLPMDDPRIQDPARWRGENLLGFALMEAREALRH